VASRGHNGHLLGRHCQGAPGRPNGLTAIACKRTASAPCLAPCGRDKHANGVVGALPVWLEGRSATPAASNQ